MAWQQKISARSRHLGCWQKPFPAEAPALLWYNQGLHSSQRSLSFRLPEIPRLCQGRLCCGPATSATLSAAQPRPAICSVLPLGSAAMLRVAHGQLSPARCPRPVSRCRAGATAVTPRSPPRAASVATAPLLARRAPVSRVTRAGTAGISGRSARLCHQVAAARRRSAQAAAV